MYVHMDAIYVTRMRTSEGITSKLLIIISSHQGLALRTRLVHCNDYYMGIGISITRNTLS